VPDFKRYISLEYWRTHQLELLYWGAGFVLFFAFAFATFPYEAALKGALLPLGYRFESSDQSLAFPMGARLENVSIRPVTPGTPPVFQSESLRVWPALGSLLRFRPGISASAQAYSGTIDVSLHRKGDGAAIDFDADKLDLAAFHVLRQIGAALGGELSGEGDITFDPSSDSGNTGSARLHAKGFLIRIPGPMPAIGLGDVDLRVHLDGNTILLEKLTSSGGDVAIDGQGTIHIDPDDWHESPLSLQFTLTPSPTARQRLAFLLNLLPHPPGTGPYKLRGTISSPVFS